MIAPPTSVDERHALADQLDERGSWAISELKQGSRIKRDLPSVLALQKEPAGSFDGLRLAQQLLGDVRAHDRDQAAKLFERLRLRLAQRLVLHASGGMVASMSANGQGVNPGHAQLLHGLLPQLFAPDGERTLGAAHLSGLRTVVASGAHWDLAYSFGVLGDPNVALPFVPTATACMPIARR